jgi:glycosyltransferase involved in cell wall biosynthesis
VTLTTVVIPARNEEADLLAALRSVLDQTVSLDSLEVVVVDGASTDRTPVVAKQALDGSPVRRWAVLTNHEATTPTNLNMGLDWAEGDVVVRVDARSILPVDYVERTRAVLEDPTIAVVGGRQAARPANDGLVARSIARALNNPFANGGARYRDHRSSSGPCDTAYLGVFRTEQLRAVDGWAPAFTSNQDFELSRRMSDFGAVWYQAGLAVTYQPRSTFRALFQQYRRFGRWKAIYWRATGDRPQPRQLVLLAAPGLAAAGATAVAVLVPSVIAPAVVAGAAGLLIVDHIGADQTASLPERLTSSAAMAIIGLGWWTGAIQEAISRGQQKNER